MIGLVCEMREHLLLDYFKLSNNLKSVNSTAEMEFVCLRELAPTFKQHTQLDIAGGGQ